MLPSVLIILACVTQAPLPNSPLLSFTNDFGAGRLPDAVEMPPATPITGTLLPRTAIQRPHSPIPIELRLDSTQQRDGLLRLGMWCDGKLVYQYETPPTSLVRGPNVVNLLLPPVPSRAGDNAVQGQLDVVFVTEPKDIFVGQYRVGLHPPRGMSVHIAACTDNDPPGRLELDFLQVLCPRSVSAELAIAVLDPITADEAVTVLRGEDIPNTPAHWCAFNLVCVFPGAFARMRKPQLQSLAAWIRAGGKALIVPGEAILKPSHLEFLNTVADVEPGEQWFICDAAGRMDVAPTPPRESGFVNYCRADASAGDKGATTRRGDAICFRTGLGRAVVVPAVFVREQPSYNARRAAVAFLLSDTDSTSEEQSGGVRMTSVVIGESIASLLLRDVQLQLPLWLLVSLLTSFVVIVGPIEFLTLRRLGRPRLTWVIFPLTSVLFTLVVVVLADRSIGKNSTGRSLVILDAGRRGEIVRYNRFDLILANRPTLHTSEPVDAISAILPTSEWRRDSSRQTPSQDPVPLFSGEFPGRYSMVCRMRQWVPAILHTTGFGPSPGDQTPSWPSVTGDHGGETGWAALDGDPSTMWSSARSSTNALTTPSIASDPIWELSAVRPPWPDKTTPPFSPCGGSLAHDIPVFDYSSNARLFQVMVKFVGATVYVYRRTYDDPDGVTETR